MAEEAGDVRARPTLSLRLRRKAQAQMCGREARGFGVGSGLGARGSGSAPGVRSRQGLVRVSSGRAKRGTSVEIPRQSFAHWGASLVRCRGVRTR